MEANGEELPTMKELEHRPSNHPLKCLADNLTYANKLRKNQLIAEDEAIAKTTNEANRSDIKEKIRVVMEQQRIAEKQRITEKQRIAKKQPPKAEVHKRRLEREWNAKLVSYKILNDQMCSCLIS